jgi:hypothetical protein
MSLIWEKVLINCSVITFYVACHKVSEFFVASIFSIGPIRIRWILVFIFSFYVIKIISSCDKVLFKLFFFRLKKDVLIKKI